MKKKCTKCGEEKELEEFAKNKRGKFGRQSECRKCNKARDSARYSQGSDKILARDGCLSPNECASKSFRLCLKCAVNQPEYAGRHAQMCKETMANPENRKRASIHMTTLHKDPFFAAERDEKIRRASVSDVRNSIRACPIAEAKRKQAIREHYEYLHHEKIMEQEAAEWEAANQSPQGD